MKSKFFIILLIITTFTFAEVNTRLVKVSNTYDSPTAGKGTLVLDVEAISNAGAVDINSFEDAFQLDAIFRGQNPVVSFSQELFPASEYNTTEEYDNSNGKVKYIYTYDNGTKGNIGASWTKVIRVSIEYDMIDNNGSINWYNGFPNFYVSDNSNHEITGIEEAIPADLNSVPLPVELKSFKATNQKGNSVELEWATATEVNNYGFEVERRVIKENDEDNSELNATWEKVAFVEGSGNSNSQKIYTYADKNPVGGTKFAYRLKQIDIDGTFEYSDEIEVEVLPAKYELYQNYPNPFNPSTKIKFSLPEDAKVSIDIYNMLGQKVLTLFNKQMKAGYHQVQFDTQASGIHLASGIYIYTISTKNFSSVKKMVLLK